MGIVIGIIVILVLAALLWYCLYYKRRNNKQGSHVVQMPLTKSKSVKVPSKSINIYFILRHVDTVVIVCVLLYLRSQTQSLL